MITAKEAFDLSIPLSEKYIEYLDGIIRKHTGNGKRSVIVREPPYSGWLYHSSRDADAEYTLKTLRENGFTVSFYYEELQFADYGLRISWEEDYV